MHDLHNTEVSLHGYELIENYAASRNIMLLFYYMIPALLTFVIGYLSGGLFPLQDSTHDSTDS